MTERKQQQASIPDDELLRQLVAGDKSAFVVLYDRYRQRLFTYCCRMMGDRELAKDALQESLLKAFQKAAMYEPGTNVAAWLFRMTRNTCIDMLRTLKVHESLDGLQIPAEEQTQDVMLQEVLTSEIEKLPEIYREAVVLRDVHGHSYEEIAQIVGTPVSTIKFRIFKARDTLRQRLAIYLEDIR